jgi:hypothetical protein
VKTEKKFYLQMFFCQNWSYLCLRLEKFDYSKQILFKLQHLLKSSVTEENGWQIYEETSIQSKESEISQQQERKTLEVSW